ncbi:MAG: DUF2141 domain-containing protein [Lysobacter sp.]
MLRRNVLIAALLALASPGVCLAADLKIELENVRAQQGVVQVVLLGSADAWDGKAKPAGFVGAPPDGDSTLSLSIADLAPGSYAVRVMHDENGNGKLDTNMVGMPTEGYGFSNNPRVMRAATFEEARFEVPEAGTSVRIVLR